MSGKLKQRKIGFKSIIWDKLTIEIGEIAKVIYHVWDEIRIEVKRT